jgi:hypothetical protein
MKQHRRMKVENWQTDTVTDKTCNFKPGTF